MCYESERVLKDYVIHPDPTPDLRRKHWSKVHDDDDDSTLV